MCKNTYIYMYMFIYICKYIYIYICTYDTSQRAITAPAPTCGALRASRLWPCWYLWFIDRTIFLGHKVPQSLGKRTLDLKVHLEVHLTTVDKLWVSREVGLSVQFLWYSHHHWSAFASSDASTWHPAPLLCAMLERLNFYFKKAFISWKGFSLHYDSLKSN